MRESTAASTSSWPTSSTVATSARRSGRSPPPPPQPQAAWAVSAAARRTPARAEDGHRHGHGRVRQSRRTQRPQRPPADAKASPRRHGSPPVSGGEEGAMEGARRRRVRDEADSQSHSPQIGPVAAQDAGEAASRIDADRRRGLLVPLMDLPTKLDLAEPPRRSRHRLAAARGKRQTASAAERRCRARAAALAERDGREASAPRGDLIRFGL